MELTQDVLDKVFAIVRRHPGRVVLDSVKQYGLTDRELVKAALKELEKQEKIMGLDLFAPLPATKRL